MARYLFIAQQTLDTWMDQDKVDFEHDVMKIKADGRAFRLIEAVRIVATEGGVADTAGLVGKVKTTEQLRKMGAERCSDSVLHKDIPYKVQEGFIAEVFLGQKPQQPAGRGQKGLEADCRARTTASERHGGVAVQDAAATKQSEQQAPQARPDGPAGAQRTAPKHKEHESSQDELSDTELLTKFLLENM